MASVAAAPTAGSGSLKAIIAPSMLASDFARLADEAKDVVAKGADWLHMDVMDGHFVPNLTLGAPIVKALRKHTDAFMDCHLMVTDPAAWIEDFHAAGASQITFHIETVEDPIALAKRIRDLGIRAGIALKPKTPVDEALTMLEHFDMVLIMTVEPGFGGQKFMAEMMDKVRAVRAAAPTMDVQVDGGLSPATIDVAAEAGANVIVAGTAVFGAKDRGAAITALRESVAKQC